MATSDDGAHRIGEAVALLEAIVEDRGLLASVDRATRRRLLLAAGRVSRPERAEQRALRKALRRQDREDRRTADAEILDATGIRSLRRQPIFETPPVLPPPGTHAALGAEASTPPRAGEGAGPELRDGRKCYVCKAEFRHVHAFYDQMCPGCAEVNWQKRNQTADLTGRVALVTGARVKIGYQAAIKLLRAGCRVLVTTRFPVDAAARYAREPDFAAFRDRLEVHGLDLRHTPSVEALCQDLSARLTRLDFIINNACQTVRRPPGFYRHLMEAEARGAQQLDRDARCLLDHHEGLRERARGGLTRDGSPVHRDAGRIDAPGLTQVPLLEGDAPDGERRQDLRLFPEGQLDQDLQQIDLRSHNSWRLTLSEVPSVELLEVHLVNAVAPFILNARLKPLMVAVPTHDKHIVNVSAMEGQFYRAWKTDKHPHTNMAKAALNMMTRTSAPDYERDGIHMNSVDTGWVTDEDPAHIAERKVQEHGFHPPLDIVDGAARILDPIFRGWLTGEHLFGLFLKDYQRVPW